MWKIIALITGLGLAQYADAQPAPRHLGCVPAGGVTTDMTARELASAVRSCVQEDQLDRAIQLYLTYSNYILFDQQRVKDESAHVIVGELNSWIFTGYSYRKMQDLKVWVDRLRDPEDDFLPRTCALIKQAGYPTYRPDYMIVRGMIPRKNDDDWQIEDFNPDAAWDKALHEVNTCPRQ